MDIQAQLASLVGRLIEAENGASREQADGILSAEFLGITRADGTEQDRDGLLGTIEGSKGQTAFVSFAAPPLLPGITPAAGPAPRRPASSHAAVPSRGAGIAGPRSARKFRRERRLLMDRAGKVLRTGRRGLAQPVADPALQQVPRPVVCQMASLAKAAQVPLPASGRVMVHVRRGENDPTRALAGQIPSRSGHLATLPRRSRQVASRGSNQRPSGRHRSSIPCGRRQRSHSPPARSNRTRRLSSGQFWGYSGRSSGRIGMGRELSTRRRFASRPTKRAAPGLAEPPRTAKSGGIATMTPRALCGVTRTGPADFTGTTNTDFCVSLGLCASFTSPRVSRLAQKSARSDRRGRGAPRHRVWTGSRFNRRRRGAWIRSRHGVLLAHSLNSTSACPVGKAAGSVTGARPQLSDRVPCPLGEPGTLPQCSPLAEVRLEARGGGESTSRSSALRRARG